MSATWTCICGRSFRVSSCHAKLVTCPLCYFILGEAVPPRFEPPQTFQARQPEGRTALASPEVLVKVAPPLRVAVFDGVDELGVPDIRIKRTRLGCALSLMLVITIGVTFLVMGAFFVGPDGPGQKDCAAWQCKVLTTACLAYEAKHGEFPDTLEMLMMKDKFGAIFVDDPNALLDPWGRAYQYDPKGPRNDGERPDIWTISPGDRQEIGNWPLKR